MSSGKLKPLCSTYLSYSIIFEIEIVFVLIVEVPMVNSCTGNLLICVSVTISMKSEAKKKEEAID